MLETEAKKTNLDIAIDSISEKFLTEAITCMENDSEQIQAWESPAKLCQNILTNGSLAKNIKLELHPVILERYKAKLERAAHLLERLNVIQNELEALHYDRSNDDLSCLRYQKTAIKWVIRGLRNFIKEPTQLAFDLLKLAEGELQEEFAKSDVSFYQGRKCREQVLLDIYNLIDTLRKHGRPGAAKRFSLILYTRDIRRHSRTVFSEVFKKHSNILGEDDFEMKNHHYSSISIHHFQTKYYDKFGNN